MEFIEGNKVELIDILHTIDVGVAKFKRDNQLIGIDIQCSRRFAEDLSGLLSQKVMVNIRDLEDEQTFYLPPNIEYGSPRCLVLRNSLESLKRANLGLTEAFCGVNYLKTGLDAVSCLIYATKPQWRGIIAYCNSMNDAESLSVMKELEKVLKDYLFIEK